MLSGPRLSGLVPTGRPLSANEELVPNPTTIRLCCPPLLCSRPCAPGLMAARTAGRRTDAGRRHSDGSVVRGPDSRSRQVGRGEAGRATRILLKWAARMSRPLLQQTRTARRQDTGERFSSPTPDPVRARQRLTFFGVAVVGWALVRVGDAGGAARPRGRLSQPGNGTSHGGRDAVARVLIVGLTGRAYQRLPPP